MSTQGRSPGWGRARGQGLLAFSLAALLVAGGAAARRAGPAGAPPAAPPATRSGQWLCPHGGGSGWEAMIALANPGTQDVWARLTPLSEGKPGAPIEVTVPAGAQVLEPVPADSASSATYVEIFGGWASTGWLLRAASPAIGLGAEPCAPDGSTTWYAAEPTTQKGEAATLVVMNPFARVAVFDVVLYQPDQAPYRDPDWSDVQLKPGSSKALRIDRKVPGKDVVGAVVLAKDGRVAVATLGVTEGGGVRSALAATAASSIWSLGTALGTGQSSLLVFAPGADAVRFGAVLRSENAPQAAGGLVDVRQIALTTMMYPVITDAPSGIDMTVAQGPPVVAALRSDGQSTDDAATGGLTRPATAWVVPPTVWGSPSVPALVVSNPGDAPVQVTLRLLSEEGAGAEPITLDLPAGTTLQVPAAFLEAEPHASVLVLASGPVVAFGVSTSGGKQAIADYAIAAGVPIPAWAIPTG